MIVSTLVNQILQAFHGGSFSPGTEEERQFYQERLRFFGLLSFAVAVSFFIMVNFLLFLFARGPYQEWVYSPMQVPYFVLCIVPLAVWQLCARLRLAVKWIRILDATLTLAICFGGVIVEYVFPEKLIIQEQAILLSAVVLIFRALILPSSGGWTALLGAVAVLPKIVLTVIHAPSTEVARSLAHPVVEVALVVLWSFVIVGLSTIASNLIYGLRKKVHEARQLGQYTLEKKLGEGSMGIVYRARHSMLRRPTAVKLLPPDRAGKASIARFEREVQLTSQLTHPNTIAIYDYGQTPDGVFYYAMEYLDGITLQKLVDLYGPLSEARTIHILKQVAGSLIEAHGNGLIHRDIKPANIMLCERADAPDVVKVLDFGLVKDTQDEGGAWQSATNLLAGTPHYLSPEAIRSPKSVGGRGDLYAVGAVGYFLLSGKTLFEGSVFEVCGHQLATSPAPLSTRMERPPAGDLEELIMGCLEKDPNRRPPDARSLLRSLSACRDAGAWKEEEARAWWRSFRGESRKGTEPALDGKTATFVYSPTVVMGPEDKNSPK